MDISLLLNDVHVFIKGKPDLKYWTELPSSQEYSCSPWRSLRPIQVSPVSIPVSKGAKLQEGIILRWISHLIEIKIDMNL